MALVCLARHLMATRFEMVLLGEDPARLRAAGEEALDEIQRLESQLSLFLPDSDIARVNARAHAAPVYLEPRLFRLLERAVAYGHATGGAFDPAAAPLLRAWGFLGAAGRWPDSDDVDAARALVGPGRVRLDPAASTVCFDRPGVFLDLGAIGKGHAVDAALDVLEDSGIGGALLHGGASTVKALGTNDGAPWRVRVTDPAAPDNTLATVALNHGESLSVSGVLGKAFLGPDGNTYGHVLDPRTGWPARGSRVAAVVASSAEETDALSTALLVLGPEAGLRLLAQRFPAASFFVLTDAGSVSTHGPAFSSVCPDVFSTVTGAKQ